MEKLTWNQLLGWKSANQKQIRFQPSQPLWSAGTQAGRHCNTCKNSWSYTCFSYMQWKKGTREYMTAERQAGVYQWGWGEQLLLRITGDIIYLQYSTTAHLLPAHWEPSSSSCLSLPSLLEPLFSLRPLRNALKTQRLQGSPLLQVCPPFSFILSPAPLFTTFVLKAQSSAFILQVHSHFHHPSPPSLHRWWELAIYPSFTHLSSCCPLHTSLFCYKNPLLLFISLPRTDTCLNSLNINWEIDK